MLPIATGGTATGLAVGNYLNGSTLRYVKSMSSENLIKYHSIYSLLECITLGIVHGSEEPTYL